MVFKKLLLSVCYLLFAFALLAQADTFVKGNDLYNQGKYQDAIEQYQLLIEKDKVSQELYFNLANAYYQNGDLAESILYYERTLRLSPRHAAAVQNLEIAKSNVATEVPKIPDFFLLKWWQGLSTLLGSLTWSILGILLWVLAAFGFRKWLMQDEVKQKKTGFIVMVASLVLGLVFQLLAFTKYTLEQSRSLGIIMKDSVVLKSAPDDRSDDVFTLSEGVKIKIVDQIETWIKVELEDREEGWISVDAIELI